MKVCKRCVNVWLLTTMRLVAPVIAVFFAIALHRLVQTFIILWTVYVQIITTSVRCKFKQIKY